MTEGDFDGLAFDDLDIAETVEMQIGQTLIPIELSGPQVVSLNELPLDIHLIAPSGQGCGVILPLTADGEEVTLLSTTGTLDLQLTEDGISFVVPMTGEDVQLSGGYIIGEDLAVRPWLIAPPIPAVCRHGISPIKFCPIVPP